MSEWKKVKLGECCEITSSKRIFLSDYVPVGIPFYRSKEIAEMQKGETISEPLFISNDKYEEIKCKFGVPHKGDLLLTAIGATLGIPFVIKNNLPFYFKDGNLIWFKNFNDLLDSSFLYTWMCSSFGYQSMQNIAIGSAQKALTISALKDLSLLVPPFDIQHRIATILSRYDSLIENYQKQIKLLEEAAQRLYKEWFVDLHFPGHENTKIVDGVPEGWEKKKIGDIVKIKSGYAFKSKDWQSTGCPVVKIKDITGTFVNSGLLDCVSFDIASKAKQYLLNSGDLVIAMTGATIGKIGIIVDNGLYTNRRVGKFFLKEEDLPFIYCFFKQESSQKQIIQLSSASSAQPNISGAQLESFSFVYNEELYNKYNLECISLFKQMISLQSQIRLLTEARDRLLPKLMSGEIAV